MGLIHFMYHGAVHTPKDLGFWNLLMLLRLADRFQVKACISSCEKGLARVGVWSYEEAVGLVSLPQPLLASPRLSCILQRARKLLLQNHGPCIMKPSKSEGAGTGTGTGTCAGALGDGFEGEPLLAVPEPVFVFLLEAEELEVESEDAVLNAALAWTRWNERDELQMLAQVILPRIRGPFLSGTCVGKLLQRVIYLLEAKGHAVPKHTCPNGNALASPSPTCKCFCHSGDAASSQEAQRLAMGYVTLCLTLLDQAGLGSGPGFLASCLQDCSRRPARGDSEPDAVLYCDIPRSLDHCEDGAKISSSMGAGR